MHFVRIIFNFPALAKCSCCLLFLFGKQNKGHNAFKCQIPIYSYNTKILQIALNICLNGLTCIYSSIHYLGYLGDIIQVFSCFVDKNFLFANYCLVFLFLFTDKNLWFSSQRRREGVVGMLMAALANIMGIVYCVSAFCQKLTGLFAKCVNCYPHKFKINWH